MSSINLRITAYRETGGSQSRDLLFYHVFGMGEERKIDN